MIAEKNCTYDNRENRTKGTFAGQGVLASIVWAVWERKGMSRSR